MNRIKYLVGNLTTKAKLVTRNGRKYYVAAMTTIVPGVLAGSKGALYYPEEQVAANVSDWDDQPLVVYHPQSVDGKHLSAKDPRVLIRQGIGFTRKSTYNGKLRHEGWFDVEACKRVDVRVLENLKRGRPMELSTGLFTDNVPENGVFKGKSYDAVAMNYKPDHVAVLPDQVGACSIDDGCGVLVNGTLVDNPAVSEAQRRYMWANHPEIARRWAAENATARGPDGRFGSGPPLGPEGDPDEDGDEDDRYKGGKKHNVLTANDALQRCLDECDGEDDECEEECEDETENAEQPRHPKDGTYQGKASNAAGRGYSGTAVDRLRPTGKHGVEADEEDDHENEALEEGEDDMEDDGAIQNYEDNAMGEHGASKDAAKATVGTEHEKAAEPAMAAVKASKDGDHEAAADSHADAAKAHEKAATDARKKGDHAGAAANDDAAALHRKAASMHEATCNGAKKPVRRVQMDRKALLTAVTANCKCAEDKAALNKLTTETLQGLFNAKAEGSNADTAGSGGKKVPRAGASDDDEDDDDYVEGGGDDARPDDKKTTANVKEYMAKAPAPIRELLANSLRREKADKLKIVRRLVANISDEARRVVVGNKLMKESLDSLEERLEMLPAPVENVFAFAPNYLGAGGGPEGMAPTANVDEDDILPLPTANYAEWAKQNATA